MANDCLGISTFIQTEITSSDLLDLGTHQRQENMVMDLHSEFLDTLDFGPEETNIFSYVGRIVYNCPDCGKRWSPNTNKTTIARLFGKEKQSIKRTKKFRKGVDEIFVHTQDGNFGNRVCNSCKVSKHRNIMKNPFLSHVTTGIMPPIVREALHTPKKDNISHLQALTHTRFYLSEYCIRTNCIKKQYLYGLCHTCYQFCCKVKDINGFLSGNVCL